MKNSFLERRRYIRLDVVFPVEFRILHRDKGYLTEWIQGFTRNVSKGGLCLESKLLSSWHRNMLSQEDNLLEVSLHIPLSKSIKAEAKVVWFKREKGVPLSVDIMGLEFVKVDPKDIRRLMWYVRQKKYLPRILIFAVGILLGLSVFFGFKSYYLNIKNAKILKDYIQKTETLSQRKAQLGRVLTEINLWRKYLEKTQDNLRKVSSDYKKLKAKYEELKKKSLEPGLSLQEKKKLEELLSQKERELQSLEEKICSLEQNNLFLERRLSRLSALRKDLDLRLESLQENIKSLEKINVENLLSWLESHQNQRTGLVLSFEGDPSLKDIGFSYDQALSVCAFLVSGKIQKAKMILDFYKFKAKRSKNGGFFNAYFVNSGEPAEYIIHSGPNIWIGIASLQYASRTKDRSYLKIAQDIARFIIKLQDEEGGIRGGVGIKWYSTEHNLDAYAFFGMLYEISRDPLYKEYQGRVLNWLRKYSYTHWDIPVNRGKGDSTIATDTYAWSIASIGPEKLSQIGMDPDDILDFAEKHCKVKVSFTRPEGRTIEVEGFDFAPYQNIARGGVVSCEWTAQMLISFKIMSRYHYEKKNYSKALIYLDKALKYFGELKKMLISSPSPTGQGRWCLPYASQDFVDTGHGWRTPKGRDTGSVASTCYMIFAYYDFNPLSFKPAFAPEVYEYLRRLKQENQ